MDLPSILRHSLAISDRVFLSLKPRDLKNLRLVSRDLSSLVQERILEARHSRIKYLMNHHCCRSRDLYAFFDVLWNEAVLADRGVKVVTFKVADIRTRRVGGDLTSLTPLKYVAKPIPEPAVKFDHLVVPADKVKGRAAKAISLAKIARKVGFEPVESAMVQANSWIMLFHEPFDPPEREGGQRKKTLVIFNLDTEEADFSYRSTHRPKVFDSERYIFLTLTDETGFMNIGVYNCHRKAVNKAIFLPNLEPYYPSCVLGSFKDRLLLTSSFSPGGDNEIKIWKLADEEARLHAPLRVVTVPRPFHVISDLFQRPPLLGARLVEVRKCNRPYTADSRHVCRSDASVQGFTSFLALEPDEVPRELNDLVAATKKHFKKKIPVRGYLCSDRDPDTNHKCVHER